MVEPSGSEEERGFQALLEEVKGQVKVFGEQVDSFSKKLDGMAETFDHQLTQIERKMDLHTRTTLSRIDSRAEELARELHIVGSRLDVHERSHRS